MRSHGSFKSILGCEVERGERASRNRSARRRREGYSCLYWPCANAWYLCGTPASALRSANASSSDRSNNARVLRQRQERTTPKRNGEKERERALSALSRWIKLWAGFMGITEMFITIIERLLPPLNFRSTLILLQRQDYFSICFLCTAIMRKSFEFNQQRVTHTHRHIYIRTREVIFIRESVSGAWSNGGSSMASFN